MSEVVLQNILIANWKENLEKVRYRLRTRYGLDFRPDWDM